MPRFRSGRQGAETEPVVGIGDVTPIGEVVPRCRVRVVGEITRMRARPTSGQPALAVMVDDGTGVMSAVWTGRRSIGGITLGRRVLLEGVVRPVGDHLELVNPAYQLLPR